MKAIGAWLLALATWLVWYGASVPMEKETRDWDWSRN